MSALIVRLHRWVGLALAIVLLLVAVSGVLLLARGPYYRWQYPSFADPITAADEVRQADVLTRIEARFGDEVRTIKLPQPGMHVFLLYLADGSEAFVDARTGALIDRWQPTERLPALLFDLHAHLLAGHTGETVNGIIAVLAVLFLALGGVLVWWPRRRAMRVRAVWPRGWTAAALLRSHAAIGVLTAAPILLFLLTGVGLTLSAQVQPVINRALDAQPAPPPPPQVAVRPVPFAPWSARLAALRSAFGQHAAGASSRGQLVFVSPGGGDNAAIVARVRLPGEWHPNGRSVVVLDPYTASVRQAVDARTLGRGTRLGHLFYPLHAARVGAGMSAPLVAAAIVAGLGLAILCLSGVVTWAQRQRVWLRRRTPAQTASSAMRARAEL